MKKCLLPALFLMILWPALLGAETITTNDRDILSVSVSEAYVFAGNETVLFDCKASLALEETPPETVTLSIDYENDQVIDDTFTFTLPEGGEDVDGKAVTEVTHTFSHVYEKPGYWTAVFFAEINGAEYDLEASVVNVAKWKFTHSGALGGVSAAPAIGEDGVIYFGSEDSHFYAVNPDGTLKWMFATGGPIKSTAAMGPDGAIYIGSSDGYIYARTSDNKEKWPPFLTGGPVFSSPALSRDGQTLYTASTDGRLYAINTRTGEARWPVEVVTGEKIISSPVVGHDGTIYIGGLDHFFYAVNPDGTLLWKMDLKSEIHGSPALDADGVIYVGTTRFGGAKGAENRLIAIHPHGAEKWSVTIDSGFASSPVVDSSGMICAGSYDNKLYAVDRNGQKLWTFTKFTDDLLGSPAIAATEEADIATIVYAAGRDGMVYALNPDKFDFFNGRELVWQYQIKTPVMAASPVVFGGTVYVAAGKENLGEIWAFAAEPVDFDKTPQATVKTDAPWPLARQNLQNTGLTGVTPETIAPAIIATDPANGTVNFNVTRTAITATFSTPVDPELIYTPATETTEAFIGFTVTPLYVLKTTETDEGPVETLEDANPEDFEIRWLSDRQVELALPEDVAFQKDTIYTATVQTKTAVDNSDDRKRLLGPYIWSFSGTTPETKHYSGDRGCFIGSVSGE